MLILTFRSLLAFIIVSIYRKKCIVCYDSFFADYFLPLFTKDEILIGIYDISSCMEVNRLTRSSSGLKNLYDQHLIIPTRDI